MATEQDLWAALQKRVCTKCIDGNGTGACHIGHDRECSLKQFLPQIVDVVNSLTDTSIIPYRNQLRSKVCGYCVHQSPEGICSVRADLECALDRYFTLIVEVIEETSGRKHISEA